MNVSERIEYYRQLATNARQTYNSLSRQLSINSVLRLVIFLAGVACVYIFYHHTFILVPAIALTVLLFLFLLQRHGKLTTQKKRAEITQKLSEDEGKAFAYDFSSFDGAPEEIDPAHDFSFDLDIFGEQSIFQLINRTCLPIGKEKLAGFLKRPLLHKNDIEERQKAVKELTENEAFCLQFRIVGGLSDKSFSSMQEVENTFPVKPPTLKPVLWGSLTVLVPALYVVYLTLWLLNIVPGSLFLLLYIFTLALSSIPLNKVKKIWLQFDKKAKLLQNHAELLNLIETAPFKSKILKGLQDRITNNKKSSACINRLTRYVSNLDQSFAFPVLLIVNPLFLWNIRYSLKIERWMKENAAHALEWFDVLAETDALISLATFTLNHPDYTFPTINEGDFCLEGTDIGHPLIPADKCVKNDLIIVRKPYFMIITGANMAGKSTYLRTIGVNHLFASIGAPVCASRFRFYPGRLLTNLRTADSLVNNESYFFAELKRLKMIINALESGEKGLFIILDEILKGTNSEDKQKGSIALMKRLVQLGGNGIIATHDLALGALEDTFPDAVKNAHFDANISNNTLSFTYKIQDGIAKNMNASFLMKSMGITE